MSRFGKKPAIILLACFTATFPVAYWYAIDPYNVETVYTGSDLGGLRPGAPWVVEADGGTRGASSVKATCNFPVFDAFSPQAMKFYNRYPTTSCPNGLPTITSYNGVAIKVNQTHKLQKLGSKKVLCWYRTVEYQRRVDYLNGEWKGPFENSIEVTGRPAFVEVKCEDKKGKQVSRMHHYIVREEERKTETMPKHKRQFRREQMNVLLLGIDSLSSHLFKRAMPKTRNFLLEKLNATEMKRYNKIGDNTFPNLLAIAAGVESNDLTDWSVMEGYDRVPFLWNEFKSAGYRTQYLTDRADFDDFGKTPTDSFNVPMLRALMRNKINFDNDCFEDKIEVKLWLDLFLEFARESLFRTGRFFTLGMIKRPTHDFPNKASAVDEHYLNFFMEMHKTGLLQNTFVVFFGDHGPRTGDYRHTYYGSIEERAANVVIYLPPWFKNHYPNYHRNLVYNADMLTTNFDIHETVRSLLLFPNMTSPQSGMVFKSETGVNRAKNLFVKIPHQRTCTDASVPPHYCLCNGGVMLSESQRLKKKFGEHVVKDINALLRPKSSLCVNLKLKSVISLALIDGNAAGTGTYRIMFKTEPGDAMFEATVQYTVRLYFFTSVKTLGLISRINMYRGQSDCIQEDKVSRMYCYCKNVLDSKKPKVTVQR